MPKIVSVQLTDHSAEVLAAMKEKAILALNVIGQDAERFAADECPVDTGRLRASISNKVIDDELAMYVGTNVEYAPYVELKDASHQTGKAHFLRDSIANHGDRYKSTLEAALKS